ncbi:hypothetical protein [Jiulongibacter sediminis]|uniref:Uncharacterized protein n=1 Tax=Jiulongibacter sediminis TaxID=1605367 RepID=A0A0P7BQA4_9BACT|nr:hypothetical protein [Jiulongibacter sediminis]KPM47393.1 hypothetical protein AFM12_14660 [Jiulongibacter sediminis]TBX22973.1 hypothetical protein TK44_14670 [Jiulongibacter sediminis]
MNKILYLLLFILSFGGGICQNIQMSPNGLVLPKVNMKTLEQSQIAQEGMMVYDSCFHLPRFYDGKNWSFGRGEADNHEVVSRFLQFKATSGHSLSVEVLKNDFQGNIYFYGRKEEGTVQYENLSKTCPPNNYLHTIGKLDKYGNMLWWYSFFTAQDFCVIYDLAADSQGNVFAVGRIAEPVSFDGFTTINPSGNSMGFILKINSSGQYGWSKLIQNGPLSQVEVFADDNLIVGGSFSGNLTFESVNLQSSTQTAFVFKTDGSGTPTYSRTFSASTSAALQALSVNLYDWAVAVDFEGNYQFGFQTIPSDSVDIFVTAFDVSDQISLFKKIGGSGIQNARHLLLSDSKLLIDGRFEDNFTVDSYAYQFGVNGNYSGFFIVLERSNATLTDRLVIQPEQENENAWFYHIAHDFFGNFYISYRVNGSGVLHTVDNSELYENIPSGYGILKFKLPFNHPIEPVYLRKTEQFVWPQGLIAHGFYKGAFMSLSTNTPSNYWLPVDGFDFTNPKYSNSSFIRHYYENY